MSAEHQEYPKLLYKGGVASADPAHYVECADAEAEAKAKKAGYAAPKPVAVKSLDDEIAEKAEAKAKKAE